MQISYALSALTLFFYKYLGLTALDFGELSRVAKIYQPFAAETRLLILNRESILHSPSSRQGSGLTHR